MTLLMQYGYMTMMQSPNNSPCSGTIGFSTVNEIQDPKISQEGHSHFLGYKEVILMAISRNTKQLMENISIYAN